MSNLNKIAFFQKIKANAARLLLMLELIIVLLLVSPLLIRYVVNSFALSTAPADQIMSDSQILIDALEKFRVAHGKYPPSILGVYHEKYVNSSTCPLCHFIWYEAKPTKDDPQAYTLSFRKRGGFYRWYCYYSDTRVWLLSYFKCSEPPGFSFKLRNNFMAQQEAFHALKKAPNTACT